MALSRRQKFVLAILFLYWPAIFLGTHLPQIPQWVGQVPVSDKVIHFTAYFFLSFLLWLTVNPNKKVNWRKPAVWLILFGIVWYGVIDEWLQMYVGRNADVRDFFADLAGAITGLVTLTFMNFWPASLVTSGGGIFAMTNFLRAHPVTQGFRIDLLLCVFIYFFFTLLWLRFIRNFLPVRPPEGRWFLVAPTLPLGLIAGLELFCLVSSYGSSILWLLSAASATFIVIVPFFIYGLLRNKSQTQAT